jgi:hypothetical protein
MACQQSQEQCGYIVHRTKLAVHCSSLAVRIVEMAVEAAEDNVESHPDPAEFPAFEFACGADHKNNKNRVNINSTKKNKIIILSK